MHLLKDTLAPQNKTMTKTPEQKAAEKAAKAAATAAPEMVDHEVTQEDLDNNPELVTEGVAVGDVIQIPKPEKTLKSPKSGVVFVLVGGAKREFSKEVHGDEFESLADQFATKHEAKILSRVNV